MSDLNVFERRTQSGHTHFQYDFRITLPDGSTYRERRKARGATSKSAARQIGLRRLQDVLRNGPRTRRADQAGIPTVAEYAPHWLETSRAERHKPSTLHNKELLLRCHILPLVGELRLDRIDARVLDMIKKQRAHLAPGSVNNILKYLVALLRCAKRLYRIEVPRLERLPLERKERWYASEEIAMLARSAATFGTRDSVFILLGGDAGLRAGEICALRWQDIDLAAGVIHVRRNLVRGVEGSPKSGRTRSIPMSARLREALGRHRALNGGGLRVLSRDGRDATNHALRWWLKRAAEYAGVPMKGVHALRHGFGSRLMNSGSGGKVVMELLGHAKLQTTEMYVHATEDHCRAAVARLSD